VDTSSHCAPISTSQVIHTNGVREFPDALVVLAGRGNGQAAGPLPDYEPVEPALDNDRLIGIVELLILLRHTEAGLLS
jgi:hypothetical protein